MDIQLDAHELMEQYHSNALALSDDERAARHARHLHPGLCHHCGSEVGMVKTYPDVLSEYPPLPGETFYTEPANPGGQLGYVWYPCPVCNPAGAIPVDFTALTPAGLISFLTSPMEVLL